METVNEIVEQFSNEKEEFVFNDNRKFVYQYNKICNAQVSLACELLTWQNQCASKIAPEFDALIDSRYVFWKEKMISFLLLEEIDGKLKPFNLDDCLYIEQELLKMPSDPGDGERDLSVRIAKIIESFFLKQGKYAELLRFSYRANPKKMTPQEQFVSMTTAMSEMMTALKQLSESKEFLEIFTKKKKSKKGSTGQ